MNEHRGQMQFPEKNVIDLVVEKVLTCSENSHIDRCYCRSHVRRMMERFCSCSESERNRLLAFMAKINRAFPLGAYNFDLVYEGLSAMNDNTFAAQLHE